jgi:hypothetical protein
MLIILEKGLVNIEIRARYCPFKRVFRVDIARISLSSIYAPYYIEMVLSCNRKSLPKTNFPVVLRM